MREAANPGDPGPLEPSERGSRVVRRRAPRPRVLGVAAIVLMAALGAARMSSELYRLTSDPSRLGAIDLKMRHAEVARWFGGRLVYSGGAVYPPASYALLWLPLGWLPLHA